jgi:transcriptional regulator with XRE-family HTH domain
LLYQEIVKPHDYWVAKQIGADIARKFDTPREIFGLAITELRTKRHKSQREVAASVGCEEFYLRNIERGKENMSFDLMFAIVDYFGMLPLSRFWTFAEDLARTKTAPRSPAFD